MFYICLFVCFFVWVGCGGGRAHFLHARTYPTGSGVVLGRSLPLSQPLPPSAAPLAAAAFPPPSSNRGGGRYTSGSNGGGCSGGGSLVLSEMWNSVSSAKSSSLAALFLFNFGGGLVKWHCEGPCPCLLLLLCYLGGLLNVIFFLFRGSSWY